jgi:hypothetical protein
MEFPKFVDSAREVSPSEFYRSTVAIDNGVDASWWPDVEPQRFLVFEDRAWIAMFPSGPCYTVIEKKGHKGSFAGLTWLLFRWFTEDSP